MFATDSQILLTHRYRRTTGTGESDGPAVPESFRELDAMERDSREYRHQRDMIVERFLPLADYIARRFDGRGEARDDLRQVARMGLVKAVIRYDVKTGANFVSFAVPTIMGEIRRHFRDNSWAVKVPRRIKDVHLQIRHAVPELSQRLGRSPNASELATELGVDRQEIIEGLLAGNSYSTLSIDGAGGGADARPWADRVGEADHVLERIENREALLQMLATLPERERTLVTLRFFASMTQSQIAEQLGISQMHVSRLLAKALRQLRAHL